MKSEDCFAMSLRLINRRVTNMYDEALRSLKITVHQLNIMMVIQEQKTISATELSEITMLTRSTLSRNLNRLKQDGLIELSGARSSKRQPIMLTEKGLDLLAKAKPVWKKMQASTYRILGPNGVEMIKAVNSALVED